MFRRTYLLLILITVIATAYAQNVQTIFTIDGQSISAGDFERQYACRMSGNDTTGLYSLMHEYADYMVMAAEARSRQMDTSAQYANAVQYIRRSLLCSHIASGPDARRAIAGMASHSQYQYNVAYIRIDIYSNSHGDTSAAYSKAQTAISRINSGTPFETVARQMSDAPDTKFNGGYLGWVSPIEFKAGEPVCNYIYSHYADGQSLSRPIKSGSSYYVIKLGGRRDAIDTLRVSPIIIHKRFSPRFNDSIRSLFATLSGRIRQGVDFDAIQYEYSDVKFSETLSLRDAYAKYTTHLLDSANAGMCTQLIETDDYLLIARIDSTVNLKPGRGGSSIMKDRIHGTEIYRQAYGSFLDSIRSISAYSLKGSMEPISRLMPDSSIFEAKWNPGDLKYLSQTMMTLGGKNYTYADFASYIYQNQYVTGCSKIPEYVQMRYSEYLDMLTLQEAYKYLETSDKTFKTQYQNMTTDTYVNMLKTSREYPRQQADTADVMRYYSESGRRLKTGHRLHIKLYSYQSPSYKKKILKTVEALAGGQDINNPALTETLNDTLMLGQNQLTDNIISGFDSGKYSPAHDRIFYLDDINSVAIVSVVGHPEELSRQEIYSALSTEYYRHRRNAYMQRLRAKHQLEMNSDAYQILARNISRQQ